MAAEPDIKRARWQLWAATFAIMGALAGAIIILSTADDGISSPAFVPSRVLLAFGLAGIVAAFALYAVDRERNLHSLHERLMQERIEAEQLAERLHFLSALTRERDTNAALLESSADGIAVVDAERGVIRFNPTMEALTGLDAGAAMGMPAERALRLLATQPDTSSFEHPVIATLTDGTARIGRELRLEHADGTARWVSATFSPVSDGRTDGPVLVLVTLRDIAEQKEQERTQRDFVSMAAHELRSPLTAIKGFARTLLLKGEQLAPERRHSYLGMIDDQSNRLARLVEDLMQVARIDAGRVVIEPEELDVGVVVKELLEQFRGKWRDRQISIEATGGLPVATADPHRLEEILINLIDNAVKYSPAGSPIEVGLCVDDGELVVSVRDHGIGISTDEIPHLFKKFSRLSNGATADIPGTGLGLYIVKGFIEAHGGRVWVKSDPGHGTTFAFTLPLSPIPAATGTGGA